jgi:uncharacterized protein (DUF427 family)
MSQLAVPLPDGRMPSPSDYWAAAELSPRRVRVLFGGQTIADSTRAMLFRESQKLPVYYFPKDDVRMDLLEQTTHASEDAEKGTAAYWTVRVGDRTAVNAAFTYPKGMSQWPEMGQHVAFEWPKMDAWYEEDEEVFVHPRDPYKRVDVMPSSRKVRIVVGGETIAESTNARFLFETGLPTRYYIPAEDVRMDLLKATETHTRCPYKGIASYWTVTVGEKTFPDIVWGYPDPIPECPKIKGLLCFFNERIEAIYVDDQLQPKPRTKWSID